MTNKERYHLSQVAMLGCIICGNIPEIHHVRHGMGLGQRNSNFNVIPLCHVHHRTGGFGVAFHAGKKTWQENFGTELELLDKVNEKLRLAA
ncbi:MAG: hypothetical protein CTY37_08595 [Methylotenera sp.]|nr:MAG: hypothetical protein CTY37_08595 [Methylotenera sp.]